MSARSADPSASSRDAAEALRVQASSAAAASAAGAEPKRSKRCLAFNAAHALKFGLEVAERDAATGAVRSAVCLFCKHFGREEKAHKKRKATTNFKYFRHSFRTDQYVQHMASQHPRQWAAYQAAPEHEKRAFFPVVDASDDNTSGVNSASSSNADASVLRELSIVRGSAQKRSKLATSGRSSAATTPVRNGADAPVTVAPSPAPASVSATPFQVLDEKAQRFEVKKAIVDVVCGTASSRWRPRGFRSCELVQVGGEGVPTPARSQENGSDAGVRVYRVVVRERLQLDLAVAHMAAGLTHRQIAKALSAVVRLTGLDPSLSASEDEVADLVRLSTAASLDAISRLLARSWAFSVGLHTVQMAPGERSFLDIRLRAYSSGKVHDLHLVALPLGDSTAAAAAMYQTFEKAMDAVFPPWRGYLIGLGSDGEAKANDRVTELMTRIQNEASNAMYRTWSGSNQLDLTLKQFYSSVLGGTFATAFRVLTAYIRSQESLVLEMGHPPSVVNPHPWLAMGNDTKWVTDKRVRLRKHLEEEKPPAAPENAWWVAFFVVNWVACRANEVFKKLQNKRLVVAQQTVLLSELAADFVQSFHVQGPFNGADANMSTAAVLQALGVPPEQVAFSRQRHFAISKASVREFIGDLGVFVNNIVARVDPLALDIVVENLAGCLANLVESLVGMTLEIQLSSSATDLLPPTLPHEIALLSGREFAALLERHSDHLRAFFSDEEMDVIDQEHQALRRASTKEKALKAGLSECDGETSFESAWQHAGGRFRALQNFAGGLATVFPCSDGDVRNASEKLADLPPADSERDAALGLPLASFSLEGTLHAQQFHQLQRLLEESDCVVL